jgi:uncharacterized protein YdeI (YjbR/CyaY-like superfamily)
MSPTPVPHDVQYFATPSQLRAWFLEHAADADELWVGYHRKATGVASIDWAQAVDEALCVGWIDGVRYRVDDQRHAQRFTPRRPGSNWSAVNVRNAERLIGEGRMRAAGRAAFDARRPERTAVYGYERDAAMLADDETDRLRADPVAWAFWEAQAPSYRRTATHWITSAKRADTRSRRLQQLIDASSAGTKPRPFRSERGR